MLILNTHTEECRQLLKYSVHYPVSGAIKADKIPDYPKNIYHLFPNII